MGDSIKRVLFVNSEIFPYLPETELSMLGRNLPQGIQERHREIRSFMPRFGCINERKNQLHEVIRLSGMNIIVGDVDRPLVIKVSSVPSARMQVYFIDNEDFFHRKQIYRDEAGRFFGDNGDRAVFFARGVLETVKKLRWEPDIIHCHGWISHILPLYLKKAYKDDPIFSRSKVVLSLYNDLGDGSFGEGFKDTVMFGGIGGKDVEVLADGSGTALAKLAICNSDAVIIGGPDVPQDIVAAARESGRPLLEYDGAAMQSGEYIDSYNSFYGQI